MIPAADLYAVLDVLVGDRLRAHPDALGHWLSDGLTISVTSDDLTPQHVATLARIAAAEHYKGSTRRLPPVVVA